MRKLIESTHVTLGGEIGWPHDWAFPYLDDEHRRYGPLDRLLLANNLIDEFHLLLTPVAAGSGQHMFEQIRGAPQLSLADVRRFASGVLILIYTPKS